MCPQCRLVSQDLASEPVLRDHKQPPSYSKNTLGNLNLTAFMTVMTVREYELSISRTFLNQALPVHDVLIQRIKV